MSDFFSKEHRIEENKLRLKELYEQYKKTENYYPLFLAYITAFGIYIFDIIVMLFMHFSSYCFIVVTGLTVLSLLYVLYLIWKFFKAVDWNFDYLPYGIYVEYPNEIIIDKPELKDNYEMLHDELLERYVNELEDFVKKDFDIYKNKKNRLSAIWKPLIISLFLYAINISLYKSIIVSYSVVETFKK